MQRRAVLIASAALAVAHATAARAQAAVVVSIDMRAEIAAGRFDPGRDRVGLRGAASPLSWRDTQVATPEPGRDGWYRLSLRLDPAPAQPVAYKFKIDSPRDPTGGWEPGANRMLPLRGPVERAFGSRPEPPPPQRSGHIERIAPRDSAWVTQREVQVWLPPGHDAVPGRRYPVLYLHDGENVFDHLAAGAEWQVDEAAQRGVAGGSLQPFIVVAVASNERRVHDYTPWPGLLNGQPTGGGAGRYARYLVDELKPLIDSRYPTRTGRAATAVGGSSLGGLVTMWLLLNEARHFGAGLVVSPSVWWAQREILRSVAAVAGALTPPRLWLDMGGAEGDGAVHGARALRDVLAARGRPCRYTEAAGAGHDEAAWAARVPAMLSFLYGSA